MRHIRPWQIFSKLGNDNHAHLVIPTVRGVESMTILSLETLLLIAVARIVKAKTILEIGTSLGYTALHLAMNTEAIIETVDIRHSDAVFEGTEYEPRICRVHGSSASMVPDQSDMVFIDGDHSYAWVKWDSEFAVKCRPKVIIWHDYCPEHPGVKTYLDELGGLWDLIHVGDTSLVMWFAEGIL